MNSIIIILYYFNYDPITTKSFTIMDIPDCYSYFNVVISQTTIRKNNLFYTERFLMLGKKSMKLTF